MRPWEFLCALTEMPQVAVQVNAEQGQMEDESKGERSRWISIAFPRRSGWGHLIQNNLTLIILALTVHISLGKFSCQPA